MNNSNITELIYEGEDESSSDIVFFIFCCFGLGALMRQVIKFIPFRLAYTVMLLLLGVIFGAIANVVPALDTYTLEETNPHLIMHIFLPVLIFESAFALDFHTFMKTSAQVLILAVPGLALSSVLICIMAQYLFDYNWNWHVGMMFGALISATDPVAVVAILREVGASKKLAIIIEGESLLNDGTAIVFFNIFLILSTTTEALTGGDIVLYFLKVAIGGPAFGLLMAFITVLCLSYVFNDVMVEITITLASTYATFYIGERFLGVSGVLAVVVLGVALGNMKTSISPEVEAFLHRFWGALAYLANTLIFIHVGVVISKKAISLVHGTDWFYMVSLYLGLNIIRAAVNLVFSPILTRIGYGMTWQEGVVLTWGGLRGAVGLTLGLIVLENERLDLNVRAKIFIHISGIVFLTLLLNATTIPFLLKLLGMNDISTAKRMAMASAIKHLQELRQKTLHMLKTDRFLADSDWELVESSCEITSPYKASKDEIEIKKMQIRPKSVCPDCSACLPVQLTQKELADTTNEAILRLLKAEKLSYWRQFEQGMLSQESVRILQGFTEVASDKKGSFVNIKEIKSTWEISTVLKKLTASVKKIIDNNNPNCCTSHPIIKTLFMIVLSKPFWIFIYVVLCLDLINCALSLVSEFDDKWQEYRIYFRSFNATCLGIYILEFILKVLTQRKGYFKIVWQILSFIIIIHGIIEVILDFSFFNLQPVILTFLAVRCIRFLRFLEVLLPLVWKLLQYQMTTGISIGYDVGRGYVAGEENVCKLIDRMVDNADIAAHLKNTSDKGKLEVIKCLAMLQKDYPQVALSVKTRQAARSVLNCLREGVQKLLEDGVLEESETEKLLGRIEDNMKRVLSLPTSIPVPPPDKMLSNVTWIGEDQNIVNFIKDRAKLVNFAYDDVIFNEGDSCNGIYIIVSGLVRLTLHESEDRDKVIDILSTGSIIGEISLLTHDVRMSSAVCETAVQAMFISAADMEEAFNEFDDTDPTLEYRLWKVCATRLAVGILMEQPPYQGYSSEKIKLRLESAYIYSGDDFRITSKMADVILIQGVAQNSFTRDKYNGPCYIPWTCLRLRFLVAKPILLVVPSESPDRITYSPTYRRQSYISDQNQSTDDEDSTTSRQSLQIQRKKVTLVSPQLSQIDGLNVDSISMNEGSIVQDDIILEMSSLDEEDRDNNTASPHQSDSEEATTTHF
ncbi:hypothetical protein SNE40_003329 [Patella caerulea]|uniref:Cyclic nucleotide-binding domain-containing protein n=1 Tax=Patella caerulea TaxID=87958 RepID=A0AAN8Q050_PATCE